VRDFEDAQQAFMARRSRRAIADRRALPGVIEATFLTRAVVATPTLAARVMMRISSPIPARCGQQGKSRCEQKDWVELRTFALSRHAGGFFSNLALKGPERKCWPLAHSLGQFKLVNLRTL
jgi:hypothetical protein